MLAETSVIATFDDTGQMLPVALCFGEERIRIEEVHWRQALARQGEFAFCCSASYQGIRRELMLYFYQESLRWQVDMHLS